MTRGFGLSTWDNKGLLERELIYLDEYRKLMGASMIEIISHRKNDIQIPNRFQNIVVNKPKSDNILFKEVVRPILYFYNNSISLVRSNQTDVGFWLIIAKLYGKKTIYRSGYSRSEFLYREGRILVSRGMLFIEKLTAKTCNFILCSKQSDLDRLNVSFKKSGVVLNFINRNEEKKLNQSRDLDYIFVGRLEKQKNLVNLIQAFNLIQKRLYIVGSGSLEQELKYIAKDNILFLGQLNNSEVRSLLHRSKTFILPSFYEGTPKALLEAAYAGCSLIVTPAPGIKELFANDKLQGVMTVGFEIEDLTKALVREHIDNSNTKSNVAWIMENSLMEAVLNIEVALTKKYLF